MESPLLKETRTSFVWICTSNLLLEHLVYHEHSAVLTNLNGFQVYVSFGCVSWACMVRVPVVPCISARLDVIESLSYQKLL